MRWFTYPLAAIALMISDLNAQQPGTGPREVVAAVFAAQDSGDVATMVSLVDPEAMAEFKQRQLDQDSIFSDLAARHAAEGQPRHTLLQAVFRVKGRSEFQGLSPEAVLTRWFEQIQKGRTRVFMQFGGSGLTKREILGEVAETSDIVHVVFREIEPAAPVPALSFIQEPLIRVITVRRTPGGWRVRLNGGLVYDEGGSWGIGYNDDDESDAPPP